MAIDPELSEQGFWLRVRKDVLEAHLEDLRRDFEASGDPHLAFLAREKGRKLGATPQWAEAEIDRVIDNLTLLGPESSGSKHSQRKLRLAIGFAGEVGKGTPSKKAWLLHRDRYIGGLVELLRHDVPDGDKPLNQEDAALKAKEYLEREVDLKLKHTTIKDAHKAYLERLWVDD